MTAYNFTKEQAFEVVKGQMMFEFEVATFTKKHVAEELSAAYNVAFDRTSIVVESEEDDLGSPKFGAKRTVWYVRNF